MWVGAPMGYSAGPAAAEPSVGHPSGWLAGAGKETPPVEPPVASVNAALVSWEGVRLAAVLTLVGVVVLIAYAWRLWAVERHKLERERRVTERTAELRRLNEALRQAVEARSRFLATVSHEIRTPMNGILGLSQLLEGTILSREQRELVELLNASGKALMTLLNGLLDLSKLEAGRLQLDLAPFDLREMVAEVVSLYTPQATAKGVTVAAFVSRRLPRRVKGDESRLRQVLGNLVSNAVKFTESGFVALRVQLREEADGQPLRLEFEGHDSGPGISVEIEERIFEPFVQAGNSGNSRYGGSGLGLAISKGLVEAMEGNITVRSRSENGGGSCFMFDIPLRRADGREFPPRLPGVRIGLDLVHRLLALELVKRLEEEGADCVLDGNDARETRLDWIIVERTAVDEGRERLEPGHGRRAGSCSLLWVLPVGQAAPESSPGAWGCVRTVSQPLLSWQVVDLISTRREPGAERRRGPAMEASGARGRVLVVDDNEVNLKVAAKMVERLDYEVLVAADGEQALGIMGRERPDLILMDCQMPGLDGYETTRRLRLAHPAQDLPIVALTASTLDGDRARCKEAGMNDYLSKPVRAQDLEAVLTKWLMQGEQS